MLKANLATFDLWGFCKNKEVLSSSNLKFEFKRLQQDQSVSRVNWVNWQMSGGCSSYNESLVNICGTMSLNLICTNCGSMYTTEINFQRGLILQPSELLAENYDESKLTDFQDVVACDSVVNIECWLEDELLLSLPMFPKHLADCVSALYPDKKEELFLLGSSQNESIKPFKGLDQLIKNNKSNT